MKRLTKPKIKQIIEYGGYASCSLDPIGQLERFAERIQDEVARINAPKTEPKQKKQVA